MIVLADLFWLILVALVLIVICLFIIVYLMLKGENKSKSKTGSAVESKATQKCSHFLGYLGGEHPKKQPIPKECFGCTLALECIHKNTEENTIRTVEVEA